MSEQTFRLIESAHDQVALVIAAIRSGLMEEDAKRGALNTLEAVRQDLEVAGMEMEDDRRRE